MLLERVFSFKAY